MPKWHRIRPKRRTSPGTYAKRAFEFTVLAFVLVIVLIVGLLAYQTRTPEEPAELHGPYEVTRVMSGDTLIVTIDDFNEEVRFIGIDAPAFGTTSAQHECFATEARTELSELVSGRDIMLRFDTALGSRDENGRLLAYVFNEQGTDIGLFLLREGYVRVSEEGKPHDKKREYERAQNSAQFVGRGLWATCP